MGHSSIGSGYWFTGFIPNTQRLLIIMGIFQKARTGTGCLIQAIGGIIWLGSGLVVTIWAIYVLFTTYGVWTIIICLLLFPIVYFAAVLIVWFTTGIFPVIALILWLASWLGAGIFFIGSRISGEDDF